MIKLKNTCNTHWTEKIKTKEDYDAIVKTGMAWEFLIDLPMSWSEAEKEILDYQAKVEYCRNTRDSNFEGSCKLEGIE